MDTPPPRLAASHALWERARRVMPGGVYGHQNGAALGDSHLRFLARVRFADDPERRRIRRWCALVTEGGAYAHPAHNWFVSAAHTTADVTRTLEATDRAFRALAAD